MDSPRRSQPSPPCSPPSDRSWSRSELTDASDRLHDVRRVLERVADVEWGRTGEAFASVALVATARATAAVDALLALANDPGGQVLAVVPDQPTQPAK